MDSDPYMAFTSCHRLYVQGMRRALRDRLESAFGVAWWETGVERALMPEQLKNLQTDVERNPDREPHVLLDATHFASIIAKHHNVVFSDAFPDAIRTVKNLRRLAGLRNDWAHVQDISFVRVRQAAELMKYFLASLSCAEALEVERVSNDFTVESGKEGSGASIDSLEHHDLERDDQRVGATPLDQWHQLQSYLVLEKLVLLPDDESDGEARVTVRVHNTAPDSRNLPAVVFDSVEIRTRGSQSRALGSMRPGDTKEADFAFPVRRLLSVEFEIVGQIDADELLRFNRMTGMPDEIVAPLRQEFASQFGAIAVREFVTDVLDAIGDPDPSMTIADIARIRERLKEHSQQIEEKQSDLGKLFRGVPVG